MISVTVTGNLTDDPHTFQTRDNTTGCELRVAVNLPSRTGTGNDITRGLGEAPESWSRGHQQLPANARPSRSVTKD